MRKLIASTFISLDGVTVPRGGRRPSSIAAVYTMNVGAVELRL